VALQLTNICRDIVEDRDQMGRVYLPAEDVERFGCRPDLSGPEDAVIGVLLYETARAQRWYEEGLQLLPMLDRRSRACTAAMAGIYHRLLDRIRRDPSAVLRGRVSLPTWEKVLVAARSLSGAGV
jgi:phytoene synthase